MPTTTDPMATHTYQNYSSTINNMVTQNSNSTNLPSYFLDMRKNKWKNAVRSKT